MNKKVIDLINEMIFIAGDTDTFTGEQIDRYRKEAAEVDSHIHDLNDALGSFGNEEEDE